MIKTSGEVTKGLIKTGGDIADKMLGKGGDVAAAMMKLTSKLSDDIGVMADRILTMADKIGEMADRIERTEVLTAKLTAALADKELDTAPAGSGEKGADPAPMLEVDPSGATEYGGPALSISGDPDHYLLYVSATPLFQEGGTVISRVKDARDYDSAWRRSIDAIGRGREHPGRGSAALTVSVAVKAVAVNGRTTALSNSVDIVVAARQS